MEQRKAFSHGLLYSVPPQNFSSLHLKEEGSEDEFAWGEFKSNFSVKLIVRGILTLLGKALLR
jgi:hypothetical protein